MLIGNVKNILEEISLLFFRQTCYLDLTMKTEPKTRLGRAILRRRRELKATQFEAAEAVRVAPTSIWMWENGRTPQARHRVRLARWLGVTTEALATLIGKDEHARTKN